MHKYPKMLNLFKFHAETCGRTTEMSSAVLDYLRNCQWRFTEKVDGMNIRVIFDERGQFEVRGRSDAAKLPGDLVENITNMFKDVNAVNLTFYGEGYGRGIQKCGGDYRDDKSFILFDVWDQTEQYYWPWQSVMDMAHENALPIVPVIWAGTLMEAYQLVRNGLVSWVAKPEVFMFAEGVVGRPVVNLRDPWGERIIVKIKHRDYFGKELVDENS